MIATIISNTKTDDFKKTFDILSIARNAMIKKIKERIMPTPFMLIKQVVDRPDKQLALSTGKGKYNGTGKLLECDIIACMKGWFFILLLNKNELIKTIKIVKTVGKIYFFIHPLYH